VNSIVHSYLEVLYLGRAHSKRLKDKLRKEEYEHLAEQRRVANWLINGTKHTDNVKKESIAKLTSDDVLTYIAVCHSNPSPYCVPTDLDGTVLHNVQGEGFFDLRVS
jgi:hypothetical protein